jgi:hypothetical protein
MIVEEECFGRPGVCAVRRHRKGIRQHIASHLSCNCYNHDSQDTFLVAVQVLKIASTDIQDDFQAVASAAAEGQLNIPRLLHLVSCDSFTEKQASKGGQWPDAATYISRDAVSHLMNLRGLSTVPNDPLLIDVRRCGVQTGD